MNKIYNFLLLAAALASLTIGSCKKTEYVYEKRPYNTIKQFTVVSGTGDSTKCLISGDSITVYWMPGVEMPASIKPSIVVDEKATISPASGESVAFSNNTVYKVTAEDGTVKTYRLNPVVTIPTPTISSATTPMAWISTTQFNIFGEYFLSGANASDVKAYMQRVKDGVEIPLELVQSQITNYSLVAKLPQFSADQDTGTHKLFVQVGNKVAAPIEIRFLTPVIANTTYTSSLLQEGQPIHTGDSLTIKYNMTDNYGGKVASYYKKNIARVLIYPSSFEIVTVTGLTITDSTVKLKLPDMSKYVGQTLAQYRFIFSTVPPEQATSSIYFLRGFINTTTPIEAN